METNSRTCKRTSAHTIQDHQLRICTCRYRCKKTRRWINSKEDSGCSMALISASHRTNHNKKQRVLVTWKLMLLQIRKEMATIQSRQERCCWLILKILTRRNNRSSGSTIYICSLMEALEGIQRWLDPLTITRSAKYGRQASHPANSNTEPRESFHLYINSIAAISDPQEMFLPF